VSFLPVGDLELLKAGWVKGGSSGVTKDVFLGNMLRVRTLSTQVLWCWRCVSLIGVAVQGLVDICREGKYVVRTTNFLLHGVYPLCRCGISRAPSTDAAKNKGMLQECGKLLLLTRAYTSNDKMFVQVLLRTHTTLRDERQRFELTSLLSDLFDQISGSKR